MHKKLLSSITKLRIAIKNYRAIIEKKKRGTKAKNSIEFYARARNFDSEEIETLGTFGSEEEAHNFYQKYIQEKLKRAKEELKLLNPDDPFLKV